LDSYKLQVAAYALLLESNYKCQVKMGGLRFTGLGIDESFLVTPELRKRVVDIANSVRKMLLSGAHPTIERLTLPHCQNCGFNKICQESVLEKLEVRGN
jgi:CRISPR/Cas system-associated exonuclease Cas4 (RecB family)